MSRWRASIGWSSAALLFFALGVGLIYLLGAFCSWSWRLRDWGWFARFVLATCVLAWAVTLFHVKDKSQ